jgi:hypothetical protein
MDGTLTRVGNAEDPVVVRRPGPVRTRSYAAELLLLDEPLPDDFEFEEPDEDEFEELDDFESEEDDEEVEGVDDGLEADAGAGEVLVDEPRLSLR